MTKDITLDEFVAAVEKACPPREQVPPGWFSVAEYAEKKNIGRVLAKKALDAGVKLGVLEKKQYIKVHSKTYFYHVINKKKKK
jgi:hypothetical protein